MKIYEITLETDGFHSNEVYETETSDAENALMKYIVSIPHSEIGKVFGVESDTETKWCVVRVSLNGMTVNTFSDLQQAYATVQTQEFTHKIVDFTYNFLDDGSWVVYAKMSQVCDIDQWICMSYRVKEEWYNSSDKMGMIEFSGEFWEYISELWKYFIEFENLVNPINVAPSPPRTSLRNQTEQRIADQFRQETITHVPDWVHMFLNIGHEKTDPEWSWYPESIDDIK